MLCSALMFWLVRYKPLDRAWVAISVVMVGFWIALAAYSIARTGWERIIISPEGITDKWLWGHWYIPREQISGWSENTVWTPYLLAPSGGFYSIETVDGTSFSINQAFEPQDKLRAALSRIVQENSNARKLRYMTSDSSLRQGES